MENDSRNLMLAMVLSLLVMVGWYTFFVPNEPVPVEGETEQSASIEAETSEVLTVEQAMAQSERVTIETPSLTGSIALNGGVIDDLILNNYNETLDPASGKVHMFRPKGSAEAYYAQTGFLAAAGTDARHAPSFGDVWSLKSGDKLTPTTPITLGWTSPTGVEYEREIAIDDKYMFTITERVNNTTDTAITVQPLAVVAHNGEPETTGTFILHEGAIRNVDGTIQEADFGDMRDARATAPNTHIDSQDIVEKGWIGLTSKYWMAVIAPQDGTLAREDTIYFSDRDSYNLSAQLKPLTVEPGQSGEITNRIYAGAKEVETIRKYRDELDIDRFDDTVDWGWFYFLTKPFFSLLHWLYGLIGNMGLAIIAMTFVLKAVLFPLAHRSYVSMSKMKKLQPQMEQIKEQTGGDQAKMQQAMMELYRKEKVNPVSGCLPILLQIPIFFSLYKVLYVTTELRHAPFFGPWQDLSAPDPTSIFNLFGLLPWAAPAPGSFLAIIFIGILPIILGISMWLTQKLNPTPQEATQKMIFTWMPWVFMFMMAGFASGLIVYWITNNMLTFVQQFTIMRSQGVKPDLFGNILGRSSKS